MSRVTEIEFGNKLQICCIHGREKNVIDEVWYDVVSEKAAQCTCCGNCFTYSFNRMDAPTTCPRCTPKGGK